MPSRNNIDLFVTRVFEQEATSKTSVARRSSPALSPKHLCFRTESTTSKQKLFQQRLSTGYVDCVSSCSSVIHRDTLLAHNDIYSLPPCLRKLNSDTQESAPDNSQETHGRCDAGSSVHLCVRLIDPDGFFF